MSFTCIPVQNEPNESPLRKRFLVLLLLEIGHLSSPSRSGLGRLILIHGGRGWGGALWVEHPPTACSLVSSMLILKIQGEAESLIHQPRSMPRSFETMAWKDIHRQNCWAYQLEKRPLRLERKSALVIPQPTSSCLCNQQVLPAGL